MKRALTRIVAALRAHPDRVGLVLAGLYGLPSLAYPFGRDQGLYFYIGREWLAGLLPYRDAFDQKPPGIYLVHALATALLGARQSSIRVFELVAVLVCGWIAALAVRREGARARGEVGALALLTAGWYFTCFDYWDTAQVELWESLALLGAYAVVELDPRPRRRALVSGLLLGAAVLFKFPAALVAVAISARLLVRALCTATGRARWRHGLVSLGWHAGGALAMPALFVSWFALHQGLDAVVDVLIGYNAFYLSHKPTPPDVARAWRVAFWWQHAGLWVAMLGATWLVGLLAAARRRAWRVVRGALFALVLVLLAVASAWVQRKFYSYHWGVVTPFFALAAGYGIAEIARWRPSAGLLLALALVTAGFVRAPEWFTHERASYRTVSGSFWQYVRGERGRSAFLEPFTGGFGYHYPSQEVLGDVIRERARPGDRLVVRGFEPAVYAVSGLRSPSRFFAEFPLNDPELAYHRDAWRDEHERACWTNPPRFVVTFAWDHEDQEALSARGYRPLSSAGAFVLLER